VFSLRTRSGAAPPASRISDLLNAGIGERRVEGFGRIAIEWLAQPAFTLIDAATASVAKTVDNAEPQAEPEQPTTIALPPLDAAAEALAVTMAERLFERLIDERIVAFVQELVLPQVGASNMPGNSQLARLRTIVRRVQLAPNPQAVAAEFARFRPITMREYERARLHGQSLRTWIERLLANPEAVWLELFETEARLIHAEQEQDNSYADRCATLIAKPTELWATVCHPVGPAVAGRKPAYSPKRAPDVALRLLAALLEAPAQVRKNREEGDND
jgi:CRISPR-associated protein Csx10